MQFQMVLILGGYGSTGRLLAQHLLEQTEVELVLAGRSLDRARNYAAKLNAEFGSDRVAALRVDAACGDDLRQALSTVDFLLVASPTTQQAELVVRSALESGVDYLDVQYGKDKLAVLQAHAPEIERAGRCFITEAGFHPGLPSALVRSAASHLDQLETAAVACFLNMGSLPYSEAVDELMEAFRDYQGQVYEDGAWTRPSSWHTRNVDFGGEVGTRQCFSMFFEELKALPQAYPSLRDLGFFIAGSHWFVDWVLTPVIMLGLKLTPKGQSQWLGRLLWWGLKTFPVSPEVVLLRAEASGELNGQPATAEVTVSHTDGYELTAVSVVACLKQYLDGSARQPGLWMMGHLVDPTRLLADMERMGVSVTSQSIIGPQPQQVHP